MKIRLHPDDCVRYGVDEVIDFDPSKIGLREAAALQKAVDLDPDELFKALERRDLEALAALVWLVVGRARGSRPDWATFDVNAQIVIEDGEEPDPGKEPASDMDATSSS